ncbi:hypothetical protein ACE6H2_002603 [Prunus campanulata]
MPGEGENCSLQLTYIVGFIDGPVFESDGPVIFGVEQIEEATGYFDETKKIGEGGYGSVYFGVIGEKVELLGYASGDDHLYLVYEYVQNGSLSEHLHDPLLKGHQPLSWTARTQIALDAAKGIEYIHDHTKARYVHRDIKTSNILLDEGLRAKVADFGLAKLVGRTNEEDIIATRLVGTPGYLPPESVKELQVTHKTDVFAFGVVLVELITGQRALFRDNREPEKMKSLITVIKKIFQDEDPESALEAATDGNLRSNYPMEDIFKMAEIAEWCLSEEAVERPEMREIVLMLSQIMVSSIEWEASLGGNSQVFSVAWRERDSIARNLTTEFEHEDESDEQSGYEGMYEEDENDEEVVEEAINVEDKGDEEVINVEDEGDDIVVDKAINEEANVHREQLHFQTQTLQRGRLQMTVNVGREIVDGEPSPKP